jgi:sec-independent protein translocase protein TatB
MLDIGWSEILVIGVVALVVLGPKELPNAMRMFTAGMRKAKAVANEFRSHVDEVVREAELHEVKREIQKAADADLKRELESAIEPQGIRDSLSIEAPGAESAPKPATPDPKAG